MIEDNSAVRPKPPVPLYTYKQHLRVAQYDIIIANKTITLAKRFGQVGVASGRTWSEPHRQGVGTGARGLALPARWGKSILGGATVNEWCIAERVLHRIHLSPSSLNTSDSVCWLV